MIADVSGFTRMNESFAVTGTPIIIDDEDNDDDDDDI